MSIEHLMVGNLSVRVNKSSFDGDPIAIGQGCEITLERICRDKLPFKRAG